jgi:hypothetical protein
MHKNNVDGSGGASAKELFGSFPSRHRSGDRKKAIHQHGRSTAAPRGHNNNPVVTGLLLVLLLL